MNQPEINPLIKIGKNPNLGSPFARWLAYLAIIISIISFALSVSNIKIYASFNTSLFDNNHKGDPDTVQYKQFEKWDTCLNGFAFSTGEDGDLKPVYKYPFSDSKNPVQGVRVRCGEQKTN